MDRKPPILVVEDDADNTLTLQLLIEQFGFEVHVCLEPVDCLAEVRRTKPVAMFVDLAMPGMSGLQIAEQLRKHPALRPRLLIAVSGYSQESDRQRTAASGFDHHLVKPVSLDALTAVLKEMA